MPIFPRRKGLYFFHNVRPQASFQVLRIPLERFHKDIQLKGFKILSSIFIIFKI
jgi:hypothetical protein